MDIDPRLPHTLGVGINEFSFNPSAFEAGYPVYATNSLTLNAPIDTSSQFVQDGGYFQTVPQDEARQPQRPQRRQANSQTSNNRLSNTSTTNLNNTNQARSRSNQNSFSNPFSSNIIHTSNPSNDITRTHKLSQPVAHSQSTTTAPHSLPTPPHDQQDKASDPTTFTPPHAARPLIPNPPNLNEWRQKFFNITTPLLLTADEYHTYFPHIDNVYSHRSTQKYKKKPFVSHYWDCRLKGRPTGTPISKKKSGNNNGSVSGDDVAGDGEDGRERKKRKRKTRERDLCDVKIKVTEFFGRDELEALGKVGVGLDGSSNPGTGTGSMNGYTDDERGELTFVLEDGASGTGNNNNDASMPFGVLEPLKKFPEGHPGADGKRWYMVQRVSGNGKDGEGEGCDGGNALNHKHSLEDSDKIKKNSVQRWILAQEKEKKKQAKSKVSETTDTSSPASLTSSTPSMFHASGRAEQTAKAHSKPATSQITFYGNSYCPFGQRVWIALELKGIPYQYVEVTEAQIVGNRCMIPDLLEVNPEGIIPCIRHGSFGVWETNVVMEYLEDLTMGHSLMPVGNAQLKAHSRLWTDHINRKILPAFYALLLTPQSEDGHEYNYKAGIPSLSERRMMLITTLQEAITALVNASHRTGPYFLGDQITFVDVIFAPWIIRLSRVLSYYRDFPRPEVGTRWQLWVDAIEKHEGIQRTVSEDMSYHNVYGGVGSDGYGGTVENNKSFAEIQYAKWVVRQEGFGLGGDIWGHLCNEVR